MTDEDDAIWSDMIDSGETAASEATSTPDPIEALRAEYEAKINDLSSRVPNERQRQILDALTGVEQPRELTDAEKYQQRLDALTGDLTTSKGVLTREDPAIQEAQKFIQEIKEERLNKILQEEGFKTLYGLQGELTAFYYEKLEQSEQAEMDKLLAPHVQNGEFKDPAKIAKILKEFKARKEGSTLPSKSITTSFKGQKELGTQGQKLSRRDFFNKVYPTLSEEQREKILKSTTKPYSDD